MSKNEPNYINCKRGLRYLILNNQDKIGEYREIYGRAFHVASQFIFENFRNASSFHPLNKPFKEEGNEQTLANLITKEIKSDIHSCGIHAYHRNVVRGVLWNYNSYRRRNRRSDNKELMKPIQLKPNKGIRYEETCVKDRGDAIVFPGLEPRQQIVCKYVHPGTVGKNKKHINIDNGLGGTLVKRKGIWIFTACYDKTIEYIYGPLDWIGTDFNKDAENFIVLSTSNYTALIIPKPTSLVDVENELKETNQTLADKSVTRGRRRYFNNYRLRLHKIHAKLTTPLVNQILSFCEANEYGVGIDNVKTGQSMGSWGQDKLTSQLLTECENRGIPFFVSNPAYTSQKCSECGYISKENRLDIATFKCIDCGFECDAHCNAARNVANAANSHFSTEIAV